MSALMEKGSITTKNRLVQIITFCQVMYSFDGFTILNDKSHKFKYLIKESLPVNNDKPFIKQVQFRVCSLVIRNLQSKTKVPGSSPAVSYVLR